ncbi:UPF0262 family protein [Lichenicoccus sp.]|uniref:UPF0262 family protein n=1 Tax=Lichenicoccus sp. TaxID=2781899 RepID=UPI003D122E54
MMQDDEGPGLTRSPTRTDRLTHVVLPDGAGSRALTAGGQDDLRQAITDLQRDSFFALVGHSGPYGLSLSAQGRSLVLEVKRETGEPVRVIGLALGPFRRIIKDYRLLIDAYDAARADNNAFRIQAIDMGRRGLHNEGAGMMIERLAGKIEIDFETGRRLFTLVCLLQP